LELLDNKEKITFAFSATNSNGEDVTNNVNPDLSIYVNGLNGNQTVRFGEVDLGENTIAAGYHHSLALKDDGTLVSWGRDNFNQVSNTPAGNFKLP
jgi:alpha-tubulin suppressor-like RCC1 family protein